jgi:hypothetical protein
MIWLELYQTGLSFSTCKNKPKPRLYTRMEYLMPRLMRNDGDIELVFNKQRP